MDKNTITCQSDVGQDFILNVVDKYKHLGGWLNTAAAFDSDIGYKNALMVQAILPLKRKFLHCEDVAMHEKSAVVGSLVLSRGLHIAGTWPLLAPNENLDPE